MTRPFGQRLWLPRTLLLLTLLAACLMDEDASAQTPAGLPDDLGQVMLIKNTLTAVNHGNLTGNYTVLRDLASEQFRGRHTAADLSNTFASLRKKKLDLSPILVTEPRLTKRPVQDKSQRMLLVGYVPTRPQAVRFALIFQPVNGGWVIDEIAVAVAPAESLVGTQRQPSPGRSSSSRQDRSAAQGPGSGTPQGVRYRWESK